MACVAAVDHDGVPVESCFVVVVVVVIGGAGEVHVLLFPFLLLFFLSFSFCIIFEKKEQRL